MVRCSECGLLAARNMDTRELEEADSAFREFGRPPLKRVVGRNQYKGQYDIPLCFVQSLDFFVEVKEAGAKSGSEYVIVKALIDQDRHCNSFIKWQQGFTPKEHQEMIDREARLKWQAEREDADRKWREQQEQRHSKEEWNRYIFLAVITIVAVILGVILGHFIK